MEAIVKDDSFYEWVDGWICSLYFRRDFLFTFNYVELDAGNFQKKNFMFMKRNWNNKVLLKDGRLRCKIFIFYIPWFSKILLS